MKLIGTAILFAWISSCGPALPFGVECKDPNDRNDSSVYAIGNGYGTETQNTCTDFKGSY